MKLYKSKAIDKTIKKYDKLLGVWGLSLYNVADFMLDHYENNVQLNEVFDLAEKAIKKQNVEFLDTGRKQSKIYYSVIDDYHSYATFYFLGTEKAIVARIAKEGKKQVNKMLERTKKEEK